MSVFFSRLLENAAGATERYVRNLPTEFFQCSYLQLAKIKVWLRIQLCQEPLGMWLPTLTTIASRQRGNLGLFTTLLFDATNPRLRNREP
jgi:hypothetical protein